ncbi:MAG: hypothetical protein V3T30_06815 [Thermodesulfobacteriota bacterium]
MEKKHFFDKSKNVKWFLRCFYASLVVLIIVDFFIHKHPDYAWEEYPSFYGAYAFVACVLLVLLSKYVLRKIVMRREDYYD